MIREPQHHQRADEQDERLQRHDETLTDEESKFFNIVGRANHQLPRLIAVVVAERQALNLGEQFVAKIEREILR